MSPMVASPRSHYINPRGCYLAAVCTEDVASRTLVYVIEDSMRNLRF
jgi:hypothetical protein